MRAHQPHQDVRIDFSLLLALAVFGNHILENIKSGFGQFEPNLIGLQHQLLENYLVGRQAIDEIDQAFFESEHIHQVTVAHRLGHALLKRLGQHVDHFQVA